MELLALVGNPSREGTPNRNMCVWDMPSPYMQRLYQQMGRKNSCFDSTVQTAIKQSVVEHLEHNKSQKKLCYSTAFGPGPVSCLWPQSGQEKRVRLNLRTSFSL